MVDAAVLILRICLGVVFLAHGAQAVFGSFAGPGIAGFSKMLESLGFQSPLLWAYLGAYIELFGGLFIVLGIFPRIAALFILAFMVIATIKVHLSKGFFIQNGGFEYNFVLACVCIALMLLGGGKFSIFNKF